MCSSDLRYVIKFLEQENVQLKTKQVIDEVKYITSQREVEKSKVMLDETLEKYGFLDEKALRGRPRTRGLKISLALEIQKEAKIVDQLTLNEQLAMVINENREPWLDRSN